MEPRPDTRAASTANPIPPRPAPEIERFSPSESPAAARDDFDAVLARVLVASGATGRAEGEAIPTAHAR